MKNLRSNLTKTSLCFVLAISLLAASALTRTASAVSPDTSAFAKIISATRSCADPNSFYGVIDSNVASTPSTGVEFDFLLQTSSYEAASFGLETYGQFGYVITAFKNIDGKYIDLPLTKLTVTWEANYGNGLVGHGSFTLPALDCATTGNGTNAVQVGIAVTPDGKGYWIVNSRGQVFNYGDATFYGEAPANAGTIVGIATVPSGKGYWLVNSKGDVYHFGITSNYGSITNSSDDPIVGITTSYGGKGYWLVNSKGDVYHFGEAVTAGSIADPEHPIVGILASSSGKGYYEYSTGGNIYNYGDSTWYGSEGGRAAHPIVGMALSEGGQGYWLDSSIGAIYKWGTATDFGEPDGELSNIPATTQMASTPDGEGYWILTQNGVLPYGDAAYY